MEEENGSLVVRVGGGIIKYSITAQDGTTRTLVKGSAISLGTGDKVQVEFSGFGAEAAASAWLNPGDVSLGSTRLVAGAGSVEGVVSDSVGAGDRRIAVATESEDGAPVVVAYGVKLVEDDSSGTSWSVLLLVIVGLAVVGGLLIPAARRRRDEDEA